MLTVLGDKSNHIAQIHLAQMLYLWPYITFFSLPILFPHLLGLILPQSSLPRPLTRTIVPSQRPRCMVAIATMALMAVIIYYNTIIHPFSLADNRHYTFYVFRILLRHPSIKYLAVPAYFLCACSIFSAFGQRITPASDADRFSGKTHLKNFGKECETTRLRASWPLIWLASTAPSLCTAPLVEPRYCIIPWIMWRLHIHHPERHQLWLETLWLLAINAVTGYIFLFWGFTWPQEPGNVQRFMW